jgi:putative spermidine/putrescine transport system permease protein
MAQTVQAEARRSPPVARATIRPFLAWLGVLPFFAFVVAFLLYPALSIVVQTFFDGARHLTLQNLRDLNQPFILSSYTYTIQLSIVTALGGGLIGFLLAYAVTIGRLPDWIRSALLTFSGVASNFAGVPLAFGMIVIMTLTIGLYSWMRRLSERWSQ